jgi:hypothetical protein
LTTPLASPSTVTVALPTSPPDARSPDTSGLTSPAEKSESDLEFEQLTSNLRDALEIRGRPGKVWLPEEDRRHFRIQLVDKVRLD